MRFAVSTSVGVMSANGISSIEISRTPPVRPSRSCAGWQAQICLVIALVGCAPGASAQNAAAATGWQTGEAAALPPVAVDPVYAAFEAGRYMETKALAEQAAGKGDATSITLLGQLYEQGMGVPQDFGKAAEWYAKAAELGDVHAQFALGMMLVEGRGLKENKAKAAKFFELAAAKNHAIAIYNLALIYVEGVARPQDLDKAAQLMERAALLDHASAQYDLAAFYKEGRGVPKDDQKASYWLGKAADAGLTNAELEYGIALYLGKGVKKDEAAGFTMLRRAAEAGNPVAQNRLAHALATGKGTKPDAIAAGKWHLLSRQSGVNDFGLDGLLGALKPDERTKAEKAAYDWQQATAALLD